MSVAAVGVASIAICYFGYQHNANTQYQNRVAYAKTVMAQDSTTLTAVENDINGLYVDETKVFLKPELTEKQVTEVSAKLESVKTSGEDFGIKDTDLPKEAKKMASKKDELSKVITKVLQKFRLQQNTNELFLIPVATFQEFHDDVAIRTDLKIEDVGAVRERLSLQDEDAWRGNITQYLDSAQRQVETIQNVDTAINEMIVDGQVTDKATADAITSLQSNIEQIRNPEMKERYVAPLTQITSHVDATAAAAAQAAAAERARQAAEAAASYQEPTYDNSSQSNNNYYQQTPNYGGNTTPVAPDPVVPTPDPTPAPTPETPPAEGSGNGEGSL